MQTIKPQKNLVTRVEPNEIADFFIQYLKIHGNISLLELMARTNLWSKDTLRICRHMLEQGAIQIRGKEIVLKTTSLPQDPTKLSKLHWLMKWTMRYQSLHEFNEPEKQLLKEFKSILKNRPHCDSQLDQYYCTPETNLERLKLALKEPNPESKNVCFLGDDDLTSLIFAMSKRFKHITVYEMDKRLIKFFEKQKENLGLKNFDILTKDYRDPFYSKRKFDMFYSDPCATIEGAELVLGRGREIAKPTAIFFLSWCEFLWDPQYIAGLLPIYSKTGWKNTKKYPEFNEYENECILSYLTDYDKETLKLFNITEKDLLSTPPIQRYGITRLEYAKNLGKELGKWNKEIYLNNENIKKIKKEGTWKKQPTLKTKNAGKKGNKIDWNKMVLVWKAYETMGISPKKIDEIIDHIKSPVLVVGAGTGIAPHYLSKKGYTVDCLDFSQAMIKEAKAERGINIHNCNAIKTPFKNNSYKTVLISTGVIDSQNLKEKFISILLNESKRLVAKNGKVILSYFEEIPEKEFIYKSLKLAGNPSNYVLFLEDSLTKVKHNFLEDTDIPPEITEFVFCNYKPQLTRLHSLVKKVSQDLDSKGINPKEFISKYLGYEKYDLTKNEENYLLILVKKIFKSIVEKKGLSDKETKVIIAKVS